MKRIITLFAIVGMIAFASCTGPEGAPGQDGLTAQAFEIKNVNFNYNATDGFYIYDTFKNKIGGDLYADETVLMYRLTDVINSTTPIWQLIPRTIYLSGGKELDYDYDFSKQDFTINARGNYDLELTSEYLDGQTFRVVIVPSNLIGATNTSDYTAVMTALKINESQVQKVNF